MRRELIRDCQRRLAKLDMEYGRALARAVAAQERRVAVRAEQDRVVAEAELSVDLIVAAMAAEVGAELAAKLVDRKVSEVKRLVKRHHDAIEQDDSAAATCTPTVGLDRYRDSP
jgi:hypothetical protein